MKILIVEDDAKIARAIREGLEGENYQVAIAKTGDEGFDRLNSGTYDLVILDWMLPGRDGISILKAMEKTAGKPQVLLLTARDAVEDRVLGLDSGADDYLVKPFAFVELLARIRALSRRTGQHEALWQQVGDLAMDLRSRQVWRGREVISLTPREFDFLSCLLRYQGEIVTRQMIAREVWKEPNRCTPLDNVIDVHLARLRKKVDDGYQEKLIQTVRGVGFRCAKKRDLENVPIVR